MQIRIAMQNKLGVVLRGFEQFAMRGQIGKMEFWQSTLPGTKQFTGATQPLGERLQVPARSVTVLELQVQ